MLGKSILGVTARADKIGCILAVGARFLSGFLCHHKASDGVYNSGYLKSRVHGLLTMLISINNVLRNFIRLGKVSCDINVEFYDFLEWICQYSKNQKHGDYLLYYWLS